MNKIINFILIASIIVPLIGVSQNDDFGEARLYYRSEFYGGFIQHTNGWGVGLRKVDRKSAKNKTVYSFDVVSMKHNKEIKQLATSLGVIKRYSYGKLNSFTILRPAIGKQKVIHIKEIKKGVELSVNYSIGASLGYLKPVYLQIATPDVYSSVRKETTERYDPDVHYPNTIAGKANFSKGLGEGQLFPGLYAKFGMGFEYAPKDEKIRYIETGITFDAHYKDVPIMAFAENQQFFIAYYLNFFFGKKSL
jgi:hypothetical protein